MPTIEQPLNIGAGDLLRGVEFTYCGDIYVLNRSLIGKKWKQRYVIISQGCLYIYADRKATKAKQSYSFKHFESATESDPENGEKICFRLSYTTAQAPILFSCDTTENRIKWIQEFKAAISEVKGHNYSADSGFGSAEATALSSVQRPAGDYTDLRYDVVNESRFGNAKDVNKGTIDTRLPVQACDDDGEYEDPNGFQVSNVPLYMNNDADNKRYDQRTTVPTGKSEKGTHAPPSDLMNELKNQVESKGLIKQSPKVKAKPTPPPKPTGHGSLTSSHASISSSKIPSSSFSSFRQGTNASELSRDCMQPAKKFPSSFCSGQSGTTVPELSRDLNSFSKSTVSFNSVRGVTNVPIEESFQNSTVPVHENFYENNDSDGSTDSGDTSPKVLYEIPEKVQSMLTPKFAREDYLCEDKGRGKRLLKKQEEGHFAVFPVGDIPEYELCVKISKGLRYFRIYSQNGRFSLYKLDETYTFSTVDYLLSYYSMNDLPSTEYKVKLQYGYNYSSRLS